MIGIIDKNGFVRVDSGELFELPKRGTSEDGYAEVLIDAKSVGGSGGFHRQSVKPYIGMKCVFSKNKRGSCGFDFTII